MGSKSLICGWGINDVCHPVHRTERVNGVQRQLWVCPYYRDWKDMITRCFDNKRPTYENCSVCEHWKYLSNFIKWVDSQPNRDWINCQLDKDFVVTGNKIYSPDTCVYIPQNINTFINLRSNRRGAYMLGVCAARDSKINPYQAHCNNPFTGRRDYLGYFPTELEAHKAWQYKKHEHSCRLADLQDDPRVSKMLRERYAPDKDWTNR